jgi:hypothetical protein
MNELKSKSKFLFLRDIYYRLKPFIPRRLQIILRRIIIDLNQDKYKDIWPIYNKARYAPEGWTGWPNNKKFALVLTHDVEARKGEERCLDLMNLEKDLGFRSAYFFVPEKSKNHLPIHSKLKRNKFEFGIHGLFHDGKLFRSRNIFQKRAVRINHFISKWNVLGFRSPHMHRELNWIHDLNILYDASTFDVDPFEPQPDGVGTIFPFIVKNELPRKSYVELPYTLPQDFTLFILMRQKNIDTWKRKLDWIAENGGMALVITHPDYMNIEGSKLSMDEYPVGYYLDFLSYIKDRYENQYWDALPNEIAQFWAGKMKNTLDDNSRTFLNKINKSFTERQERIK